jgi:hypothetical protein
MAVRPSEFLTVARQVIHKEDEVFQRTAANRAYFSCLLTAREAASHIDWMRVPGGTHERVIRYYTDHRDRNRRAIGYMLIELRALRIVADYDLIHDFSSRVAQDAISSAERCQIRIFNL